MRERARTTELVSFTECGISDSVGLANKVRLNTAAASVRVAVAVSPTPPSLPTANPPEQ